MSGVARRPSYGPNSPLVGERGERTRRLIIETALALFEERGFHATLVDDIARAADVSRATVYQYFESKETLFVELAFESGAQLLKIAGTIGELGPTAEGLANLRSWIEQWSDTFESYSTVFIQWANANSPRAALRTKLARFLESHTRRLATRLEAAGVDDPQAAAVLMLAALERGHYIRHLYWPGATARQAFIADLGTAFQLYLFPTTPLSLFEPTAGHPEAVPAPVDRVAYTYESEKLANLGPHSRETARKLLDASAEVFAEQGYAIANVDQIVSRAGVARGTFYKYFDDKLDVMLASSTEALRQLSDLAAALGECTATDIEPWLERFLDLHDTHLGVLRAWTERLPDHPALTAMSWSAEERIRVGYEQWYDRIEGAPLIGRTSGRVMLISTLENFPSRSVGTSIELDRRRIIAAEAGFLTRGLTRGRRSGRI